MGQKADSSTPSEGTDATQKTFTEEFVQEMEASYQKDISSLKANVFELEKKVNSLNEIKSIHIDEIQAKDKIINALSDEIVALRSEDDAPAVPTVKVGKKTYVIAIPRFNYGGKELTAADVKADAKLAAELVEAKSGVLVESV